MTQKDVYEMFKTYFPQFAERAIMWFPNGRNSIRVRQSNGLDFIFTYESAKNWSFETVDNFIKRSKGAK